MIEFIKGNYKDKNQSGSWSVGFGMQEAEITKELKNKTLKEIAEILLDQYKIKNGAIELHNIGFTFIKNEEDKEGF